MKESGPTCRSLAFAPRHRPILPQFLPRRARVAQAHVTDFHDGLAVRIHQRVCDDIRLRPVADFANLNFVSHQLRRLQHLPAALELAHDARDRLQRHARARLHHPAQPQQMHAQRVQTALIHERARHHAVVHEMAGDEPVVGMNVRLATNQPEAKAPAARLQSFNAMHQSHPPTRQRHVLRQLQPGELFPEARNQIAFAQRVELLRRIRLHRHRHEVFPIRRALAGLRLELERGADDALARRQILL